MAYALEPQHRDEHELTIPERERLEAAHRELSAAVAAYDNEFVGEPLNDAPVVVHAATAMAAAQERVDNAEAELWRLREELLGWRRPPSAQRAATVADWFSPEDAIYDDFELNVSEAP